MITEILNKLIARRDLAQGEAAALLEAMLGDNTTDAQIAAALVALAAKGETEEELAGFAETMRARSARIPTKHAVFVDTCGTGGSGAKTFNVSTAAAFVVAAAGVPVAKHGNVGVTSKSGSADVLRALGVRVDLPSERVAEIFDEIGICFMFAPLHHAATKRVAMIRRELGVRTIFNLLGPLTNPADAPFQVIGVSSEPGCEKVAKALARLGTKRAWVVRGEDGLDEITLAAATVIHEATGEGVHQFRLSPEEFGMSKTPLDGLRGGTAEENAAVICSVLSGERTDSARDLVLVNAAASLYVTGQAENLQAATRKAAEVLSGDLAMMKLEAYRRLSNS